MLLSIITPFFNSRNTIEGCIDSFIRQATNDVEMILVNDGSTDDTLKIVQKYMDRGTNIICKGYNANMGVNYARNYGIELSLGTYIMFLDSDDKLLDGAIETIVELIKYGNRSHYLLLTNRSTVPKRTHNDIEFRDWVYNRVTGDFVHVLRSSVLKANKFSDKFNGFENITWFKIFSLTEPQLLINQKIVEVSNTGINHLSTIYFLDSMPKLRLNADAEEVFLITNMDNILRVCRICYEKRIFRLCLLYYLTDNKNKLDNYCLLLKNRFLKNLILLIIHFKLRKLIIFILFFKNRNRKVK